MADDEIIPQDQPQEEPKQEAPNPETSSSESLPTSNPKTEKMEIHHAEVHGKKKWTDYLFEFFMLFLAVFCGFFAEYKLEQIVEHKKEKEYMQSMIEDMKEDTAKINQSLFTNYGVLAGLDSLVKIIYQYKKGDTNTVKNMYLWYMAYGRNNYTVHFTDRTISQLKSSGSFRSIRSQAVSDSILRYDEAVNWAIAQEITYKDRWLKSLDYSTDIFDYRYISYNVNFLDKNLYTYRPQTSYKLLTDDPLVLSKYCNLLELWKQTVVTYIGHIYALKFRAQFLIPFLKDEYNLK